MRGALQQGQDGGVDNEACCGKDQDTNGDTLSRYRLAAQQEVWPCRGRVQALNYVGLCSAALSSALADFGRNPDVWNEVTFPTEIVKNELQSYIGKRLTPQPTKVRADVEVTCFGYEGIDAVKNALRAAEAQNTPETQVKVKLVSPPLYVLTSQCLEKNTGITTLELAIIEIDKNIKANGGGCVTRMAPKAVTENDDAELQALMEKRERENAEISGDEDESESDEAVVKGDI